MYNLQYNYGNDDAFYSQQFNIGSWGQQTNPPPNPAVQRKIEQDRMYKLFIKKYKYYLIKLNIESILFLYFL